MASSPCTFQECIRMIHLATATSFLLQNFAFLAFVAYQAKKQELEVKSSKKKQIAFVAFARLVSTCGSCWTLAQPSLPFVGWLARLEYSPSYSPSSICTLHLSKYKHAVGTCAYCVPISVGAFHFVSVQWNA